MDEAVEAANTYIRDEGYTKTIEIIDYTPYTMISSAKRRLLKTLRTQDDGKILIKDHEEM